jgi:hypothetical protein
MKENIIQKAMRNGVTMPDGRHWTWRGHEWITNRHDVLVRVEIWSSACRWCGAEFKIKQKLLSGKPAYNFQTQNCQEHRGQRARIKPAVPPDDGSDLV